jgi:Flp pilus assembly pilin Flp
MKALKKFYNGLMRREEGQTLTEYGLIIFFIALVCIVALTGLGVSVSGVLQNIADTLAGL